MQDKMQRSDPLQPEDCKLLLIILCVIENEKSYFFYLNIQISEHMTQICSGLWYFLH